MQVFWQKSFKKVAFLGLIWLKSTKMGGFRGLKAKNVGIDGMDVFCEGLEVMVYVLWVGDENIRDVGRTADGIWLDGGRNPIGRRTESDWTADANGEKSWRIITNRDCKYETFLITLQTKTETLA